MEEDGKPTIMMCTLLAIDHTDYYYRLCSSCERPLPDNPTSLCKFCNFTASKPSSSRSKRLFRFFMSLASDTKVFTVICFDGAARVLFGCSADEFFDFAKLHPFAAASAGQILEGEMLKVTLSKPTNGIDTNLRLTYVVPLRTGFQPAIVTLKELYGGRSGP
ncbi:hypothetical protein UlMin_028955 [Ulmus minor]